MVYMFVSGLKGLGHSIKGNSVYLLYFVNYKTLSSKVKNCSATLFYWQNNGHITKKDDFIALHVHTCRPENVKQSNQIDIYIYICLTSIVIGQKSTNQIAQYMVEIWRNRRQEHSEGLRMNFGQHSDIVENDILTMQRFLDVSRFLYSGGWQVCACNIKWHFHRNLNLKEE